MVLAIGAVLGLAQGQRAAVAVVAQEVTKLADDLLQFTRILAPDSVCLERAFERVRTKKQPARNGKIKDAYLLEQCLELCRVLRGRAFQERKLLCSSNTSDFAKPNSSQFDQDIAGDASQAGLEYFTSLSAAVGSLRLSSA